MDVGFQMMSALQYMREQKIIHRDLKPANVFLIGNGNIKLGDFGISKVLMAAEGLGATGAETDGSPFHAHDPHSAGCLHHECNQKPRSQGGHESTPLNSTSIAFSHFKWGGSWTLERKYADNER